MIMLSQAFSRPLNCLLFSKNNLKMRLFYLFLFSSAEHRIAQKMLRLWHLLSLSCRKFI
ncbi:hypothetical protein HDEF_1523 [Candidatus Hamiltonella defensa 5AT (Acyrthosiphon pisum)]|uniref:Uncharacterized protein n=1 Tax=Hamiltonella defensa subsp. Acyrthosiphon pisum (strain 5AT) TaxID=572265 RepID=C4K6F3_HAMD5|nr:hypothetical protein HDEF_1523 [Candidatus Hamiltonella defensa 5AT (Acyrthosiphon pisum)]